MLKKVNDVKSAYAFVKEGWAMVKKYNWYERTVYPYNFPIKVTKLLHEIADYGKCTKASRDYLDDLANGLGEILNAWEEQANEPKVTVIYNGKKYSVNEELAEMYIIAGAELAQLNQSAL